MIKTDIRSIIKQMGNKKARVQSRRNSQSKTRRTKTAKTGILLRNFQIGCFVVGIICCSIGVGFGIFEAITTTKNAAPVTIGGVDGRSGAGEENGGGRHYWRWN